MAGTSDHAHQDHWYEIRLRGHLDQRWAAWLDGLQISRADDGTTVLRGPVADQAALHGVLGRLRDVGLPLVSVTQVDPGRRPTPASITPHYPRSST